MFGCGCDNGQILWFIILFLLLFCNCCGNNGCSNGRESIDTNCGCGC